MSFLRPRFKGERAVIAGIAIDATGSGMYVPFNLIFFHHVTGLPLSSIGLVLTVTSLIALAALPLGGSAVDRFGALKVLIALYLLRAIGFALYPLAHGIALFAMLALVTAAGTRAAPSTLQARFAELLEGTDRDRMQALSRSLGNAGLGAGTMIASVIIATGRNHSYVALAWLNAASFVIAALLALRTPASPRAARKRADRSGGYRLLARDRPFLALTLANLLLAIGYTSLTILLPVYAIGWLHLPDGLIGSAFIVNTIMCATLGVPVAAFLRRRFSTRNRMAAAGTLHVRGRVRRPDRARHRPAAQHRDHHGGAAGLRRRRHGRRARAQPGREHPGSGRGPRPGTRPLPGRIPVLVGAGQRARRRACSPP